MKQTKRGWHFKKSFLVFCAAMLALLVIVLSAVIIHSVKGKQTAASDPNSAAVAGESETKKNKLDNKKDQQSTAAPITSAAITTAAPTAPPVTDPNEKVVYLTFDDGPSKNTDRIIDILKENGIKATFFVIHSYDGCEDKIKKIYESGNAVGLHSYTHDFSIYSSEDSYFDDLNKISDLVYNATGTRSKLVRFPGGTSNTISENYCSGIMTKLSESVPAKGYRYFDWDWDSTDASKNVQDASVIYEQSIKAVDYGDNHVILLMHDAPLKTTTADALPDIIKYYKDHGYKFDVLSENSYTYQHNPNN